MFFETRKNVHNIQLPFGNICCDEQNPVVKNINSHNEYKVPRNISNKRVREIIC